MEARKPFSLACLLLLFLLFLSGRGGAKGSGDHHHQQRHRTDRYMFEFRPAKLFVFGDSYADTGNARISVATSWKLPYGITFPGRPAGRFSNGRVSTDYLAKLIGIKSPVAYRWRNVGDWHKVLKYGVNFAYGGTGVFNTLVPGPNMTTQVDQFQQLLHDGAFTPTDLGRSAALVSVAGNDYFAFLARNGSIQDIQPFIRDVVNQMALDLRRIHRLGVKKIAVGGLQPLGCLPRSTLASSFQRCNDTENTLVNFHNTLLKQAVEKLNTETKDSTFMIIDLYDAFMTVFKNKGEHPGSSTFQNPLKTCCIGVSSQYSCGSKAENGENKYTMCDDPEATFFWDDVHPTQAGWRAVYAVLQSHLKKSI